MCTCFNCGHQNPDKVEFCQKCAAALGISCPTCGQPVPAGSKFCSQCGARLSESQLPRAASIRQALRALMPTSLATKINAAAVEITGERREVTVLFLDMANFTATAHVLDSEDIYLLTDEAMRLLAEVVYKYEGIIDKYTGDGLMALFGAPVAHENDPERAVRAALEMHTVLQPLRKRFKQEHGLDYQTRIGINTGRVIAGQVGSDLHMEYTVIGDTVNLANRLQGVAEPDTMLVSFATYQRTRPLFRYKTLPPFTVKGKPHPIRAFRPLGLRARPGQVRGLPGLQVPMIGRQCALAQLQDTLTEVCQHRHSQIVLITGEAGVGKSRLVVEFYRSIPQPDVNVYQGSCMTYARSKPLWLIAHVLLDIMRLSDTDPIEVQREILQAYLSQMGLANNDVLPYLTNVLGLEQTDPRIEARLRHFDTAVLQKLTHAAMRQVLLAEARLAPTVLVFEDLHWVDPASRDFLEHLIQTTDDVPLMLILVSRDAEHETTIRPLIAAAEKYRDRPVDIQLRPLSEAEGQLLVDQLLEHTFDEAQALKRRIAERAEGNPFYAEEIVRMLIDQGGLTRKDDAWQVTPRANELVRKVPGTLNGLILARFDRLPESLRQTLQKAAVLGASFPVSLIQGLNGAESPSKTSIAAQISALEARQFLIASLFGSEQGYAFRHVLTHEAVYSTLLRRDRKKIHERVAQVIEQGAFWTPDERTEALAYHYAESANPSKAVPHLIAAAENAARRCAHETAIQHYRQALALMQDLSTSGSDQTFDRLRASFLRVQIGLGQALKFAGEYSKASQTLEEAMQSLLRQSLRTDSTSLLPSLTHGLRELADIRVREGALDEAMAHLEAGLGALGDEGARAHLPLWRSLTERLAWVRFRQGKLEEAFGLASSATVGLDPEGGDDPMTLASLYNTLGGVFWQRGNRSEATGYVERSLELYQSLGYSWGVANAYTNLGILYYVSGRWRKALESFEQSDAVRREIGYMPEQASNLKNLGLLRMAMGDHAQARKDLKASRAISQRLGDDFGIALAEVGLGHLAVIQSRFEEAASHIEVAMGLLDAAGEEAVQARWLWALVQAEQGDLQTGLESAEQALQMARAAGLTEAEADCRRVLGILHSRAGDYLEAETLLRESIDLWLQLNAPYGRGLALLELGRLYQHRSRAGDPARVEWRAKALTALNKAAEQFEHLGAAYDLERARAAMSQLQAEMLAEADLSEGHARQAEVTVSRPRPGLPEGEWHTAAIVWLSLSPPPDADEEAVFETLALVNSALSAIAQEYRGQVIRRQDGLTVVFGAPAAYEDDAERAVQTAWHMIRYLREPAQQTEEVPLTFRVAVSQGDVVAGHIGPHFHTEFVVKGEAVQAAQRVAESAPTGNVWVTEPVRAATERLFIYQPASPHLAARLADLSLWELAGLHKQPDPARGLPALKTRLIGRETVLQAMTNLSQNLNRSIGGLIWIEGEPGIGKSRLIREFATSIAATSTPVWAGTCSPQKSGSAFALFSDLLAQALNLQPTDTPDQIRARLDQTLQAWPRDAQVTRPYLEMLLGVWPGGLYGERLAGLEPDQLRQQTFVALRRLFKSLASEQPLMILLDDLHWIDPMSAELMQFLLTIVASAPVLFVCAQRRQGADSPNDRLVRLQSLIPSQTVRLRLERLSTTESETLLSELLPQAKLPATLRTTILERSEGNPYFIEEFVRLLVEQGYLQHHQGRWEVNPDVALNDLPLPSSLETLIRSRIDALPPELKRLMQCAAVIGAPFETNLLESISELPNVEAALSRLESRLLVCRGAKANQYQFDHSLIEGVVYNTMLKARRKTIHLSVAQALEARWVGAEADHAEQLAYHFTRADESGPALTYLMLAGERAAARYANEEAITYLEQAAQRLGPLPEAPDSLRYRLAAGLGDAYRALGRYADSEAALEAGLSLVETGGLSDNLRAGLFRRLGETAQKQGELDTAHEHLTRALALLGQPVDRQAQAEVARCLTDLAWTHFLQGHFDQAQQAGEASLEVAQRAGAVSEMASAENLLGGVYYRQSEWTPALHHTRRAMVLREQMGYTWGVASTLSNLGILAVSAGDWNKARSFFERSLALRQEVGDVEGVAIVHNNLGTLARDQGELDVAEFHFRESLAVATPFEIGFHIANSTIGLAHVLLLKEEIEAAHEAIAASLAQAETIGAKDMLAEIHRIQAETLLARSAWDEGQAAAQQSASLAAETGNRSLEAAAWRVASAIELGRGDPQTARDSLAEARRVLADATDELETGRVAAQAGRISLYEGQLEQAEADLRVAKQIFMRLGASLDLRRVEEALKQPFDFVYPEQGRRAQDKQQRPTPDGDGMTITVSRPSQT